MKTWHVFALAGAAVAVVLLMRSRSLVSAGPPSAARSGLGHF